MAALTSTRHAPRRRLGLEYGLGFGLRVGGLGLGLTPVPSTNPDTDLNYYQARTPEARATLEAEMQHHVETWVTEAHFDWMDSLILQISGDKHWQVFTEPYVHSPRIDLVERPSSAFLSSELSDDFLLSAGDLLYMPRGFVHFATTTALKEHSTHVTISTYQKFAFVDFMTAALPRVLSAVAEGDVDLRRGLPVGVLDFMGRGVEAAALSGGGGEVLCNRVLEHSVGRGACVGALDIMTGTGFARKTGLPANASRLHVRAL